MSPDPDIQARWDDAVRELARRLKPHVLDHTGWDLARAFVLEYLSATGWRPPLARTPDWLQQARARRAQDNAQEQR